MVRQVVRDLERLGHHGKVILTSDREEPIKDLLRSVARMRGDRQTLLEHSPVGDSKANGLAERAVQTFENHVRTQKIDFEKRMNCKVNVESNLFAWMVEHSADLYTKLQIGSDGLTPYQRLKGKRYRFPFLPFGVPVMFKVSGKVRGGRCPSAGRRASTSVSGSLLLRPSSPGKRTAR